MLIVILEILAGLAGAVTIIAGAIFAVSQITQAVKTFRARGHR